MVHVDFYWFFLYLMQGDPIKFMGELCSFLQRVAPTVQLISIELMGYAKCGGK
jgi:hypothetical protein